MNTLSTINNRREAPAEAGRGGHGGAEAPARQPEVRGRASGHSTRLLSTSLHKVPFKITYSFLKYTSVIVNLHPVVLNTWYSV